MIPQETIEAYDKTRDFAKKGFRSACYAPFASLYFTTVGNVVACCKNQAYVLGNVAQQSLDEIWRGPRITALRRALIGYNFKAGCGHCEWQIKGGNHKAAYTTIFEEFPVESETPEWPSMMEFTISNSCNFECIMCIGELSSSIRKNREQLPPLPRVYGDKYFEDLRKYLPHLRRAKFFGGEPFLATENHRVWDMMIEDRLRIPSHITTNGSIWNAQVERFLANLPISLSVSLDGATKDTFESVRKNGIFSEVMTNTRRFLEYTRQHGTYFSLLYCLMRQNWHEFLDIILLAEEMGCDVWVNTVVDPPDCSLFTLPPAEMLAIADKMDRQASPVLSRMTKNRWIWENEVRNLRNNANERQAAELEAAKSETRKMYRAGKGADADHVSMGWELVFAGRYSEALAEVDKTPTTHSRYWYAIVLRAHVLAKLRDAEGCEREVERAIKMNSRRPEPFVERAWLRLEQGRLDEGLADASRALAIVRPGDPAEPGVHDVLGFLHSRKGNGAEAKAAFDRLIELRPSDPKGHVHRGWAYSEAGMAREALADAEAALALAPEDEEARRLREIALQRLAPTSESRR